MDSNLELVGVRLEIGLERVKDALEHAQLSAALESKLERISVDDILIEFEKALLRFASSGSDHFGFFLNDARVSEKKISRALASLAKGAALLRDLNAIESRAVAQLVHYHLNPNYVGDKVNLKDVINAANILSEVKLNRAEIKNPKSIVKARRGRTKNSRYTALAVDVLEIWRGCGRSIDRSDNRDGVLCLTKLLVKCFDISIKVVAKFDEEGNAYSSDARPVLFEEETSTIASVLDGYLRQVIQASMPVKKSRSKTS